MREVSPSSKYAHDQISVRRIEHATHAEWYLTGRPPADRPPAEAVQEVFQELAKVLDEQKISILHEKIYGLVRGRDDLLAQRAEALSSRALDASLPVTFLEGTPASGAAFAGIQAWGVTFRSDAGQRVETVQWQGRPVGREWFGPNFRKLALASIDGSREGLIRADSPPGQAQQMFERATAVLSARGYSFHNVARTWIYLARILDWYGDFNRIRNAYYASVGLATAGDAVFPASTGIQARHDSEQCLMDVLAIDGRPGSNIVVRPLLRSSRQGQAFAYGSAFSRAMVIEQQGSKVIHVSGTASIDCEGRSMHAGDAAAQYLETLRSVAALLEEEGASLSHICQGTLFSKSAEVADACRHAGRGLGLPELPLIEVVADVCRPELLVELEAVAVL